MQHQINAWFNISYYISFDRKIDKQTDVYVKCKNISFCLKIEMWQEEEIGALQTKLSSLKMIWKKQKFYSENNDIKLQQDDWIDHYLLKTSKQLQNHFDKTMCRLETLILTSFGKYCNHSMVRMSWMQYKFEKKTAIVLFK